MPRVLNGSSIYPFRQDSLPHFQAFPESLFEAIVPSVAEYLKLVFTNDSFAAVEMKVRRSPDRAEGCGSHRAGGLVNTVHS